MAKKIIDIQPKPKKEEKEFFVKTQFQEKEIKKIKAFSKKRLFIFIFFIFLLAFPLFSFNFAKVKIKIWPEIESLNFKIEATLSKEAQTLNFEKKILPAKIFEIEEEFSDEFLASGKVKKEEKAQGVVRIFNNSNNDQVLVANTRLQAPVEKFKIPLEKNENPWFRTLERVVVPANGYVDVKVIADAPGEKYNIEPSTFSIPGLLGTPQYTLIHGKSTEAMKGGGIKEVAQVIKEDIEKAEKELTTRVENEIIEILRKKVPNEFEFSKDILKVEILEKKPLSLVGEEKEKFTFRMKIKAKTLAFQKKDLEDLIEKEISVQASSNKEILKDTLKYEWKTEEADFSLEKSALLIDVSVNTYPKIDPKTLKEGLVKLSLEEAKTFLEHQTEIKKVRIEVFPFWLRKLPGKNEKIEVIYPLID